MRLGDSLFFSSFAGACFRLNHVDEGLPPPLAHRRDTTERLFETELGRLKGDLLVRRAPSPTHARHAAIRNADRASRRPER